MKPVFGDDSAVPAVPPAVVSPALQKIMKIIASYYLVRQSNPNIDLELYRKDYEDAITLLENIRDGQNNLVELTYRKDDPDTPEDESANGVSWSSNLKRTNCSTATSSSLSWQGTATPWRAAGSCSSRNRTWASCRRG